MTILNSKNKKMTHKTLFRLCQTENISFSCFYFHSLIFFPEKRGWWTEGVWCACKHQCSVCSWQTKVQCSVFILIAKSGKESKAKCKLYTLRADWEGLKGQLSAVLMQLSSCFSDHKSRTSARLRLEVCVPVRVSVCCHVSRELLHKVTTTANAETSKHGKRWCNRNRKQFKPLQTHTRHSSANQRQVPFFVREQKKPKRHSVGDHHTLSPLVSPHSSPDVHAQ